LARLRCDVTPLAPRRPPGTVARPLFKNNTTLWVQLQYMRRGSALP
jgi:hypothetical protein